MIAELPSYLESMGGGEYKGFIFALFTLTAMLARPISGKLADTIGRKPVMLIGLLVAFVCCMLYPVLNFMAGFMVLRLVNGMATGFTPTGTSTYIADIVPPARVGEAMGILGLISNVGTAIAPFMGGVIKDWGGMNSLFYTSGFLAVLSILLIASLPESLENKQRFSWKLLQLRQEELAERTAFAPSVVMFLCVYAFGAMLTTVPDLSRKVGFTNNGMFYGYYTVSSLLVRFLAGKLSDKLGRVVVLRLGAFMLILAFGYLAFAQTWVDVMVAGILYGISVGITSPTLFAWAIDLCPENVRGRSISTIFIALEAGIMVGSLATNYLYANNLANLPIVYGAAAFCACLAWAYLLFGVSTKR